MNEQDIIKEKKKELNSPTVVKRKKTPKSTPNLDISGSSLNDEKDAGDKENINKQKKIMNYFGKMKKQREDTFGISIGCFQPVTLNPGTTYISCIRNYPDSDFEDIKHVLLNSNPLQLQETIKAWKNCKTHRTKPPIIAEDSHSNVFRVKFLKFHENLRPPYFGTWRKHSLQASGRRPFGKERNIDYDNDSDLEWQECESGEEIYSENEEIDNEEPENDESEDSFLVPHGYLSDGEGISESENEKSEDENNPDNLKQSTSSGKCSSSKISIPFKRLKPHFICFFCQENSDKMSELEIRKGRIIMNLFVRDDSMLIKATENEKQKAKLILPDEVIPQLINIIHNKNNGIKKLIDEFQEYWTSSFPNKPKFSKSLIKKKIREISERKSNRYIVHNKFLLQYSIQLDSSLNKN